MSNPRPWPATSLPLLLVCSLAILCLPAPGRAAWTVLLHGTDITGTAAPQERGSVLTANCTALVPLLGLSVQVQGTQITLTDATGTRWQARQGDSALECTGAMLPMRAPMLLHGAAIYLPLETIARLANLTMTVDDTARTVRLTDKTTENAPPPGGWEAFTLEKTTDEKAQEVRLFPAEPVGASLPLNPPPTHGRMTLALGMGYVQGADWGLDLSGFGDLFGRTTQFGLQMTSGKRGLCVDNASLRVADTARGITLSAGRLPSELRGSNSGARVQWTATGHAPAVSLYIPDKDDGRPVALAFRDEWLVNPHLRLGGEVDTDGALFLKGQLQQRRLALYGYYRLLNDRDFRGSQGIFASYDLGSRFSLYGGISTIDDEDGHSRWSNLALRLPLTQSMDLTLEHIRSLSEDGTRSATSAMVSTALGPVNLLARYQWGQLGMQDGLQLGLIERDYQELLTSASYAVNSRLHVDYQMSRRWGESGVASQSGQLVSRFQCTSRTEIQLLTGAPEITEPSAMRMRLNHRLDNDLVVTVDYGQLTPYQGIGARTGERGLTVMLRRQWGADTPAVGGEVSGQVTGHDNRPLPGIAVNLGSYRVATDEKGHYRFKRVPPGEYELSVDATTLPADYAGNVAPRTVTVGRYRRQRFDFQIMPLHSIRGRVYCDANDDGRLQADEALSGVVLRLGDRATATTDDGTFTFDNLAPGAYQVTLDVSRLPRDLAPASLTAVPVQVETDGSVDGLLFRLVRQDKPVIFQALKNE